MARTYKCQKIKNSVKQQSTEALVEQFNALLVNDAGLLLVLLMMQL